MGKKDVKKDNNKSLVTNKPESQAKCDKTDKKSNIEQLQLQFEKYETKIKSLETENKTLNKDIKILDKSIKDMSKWKDEFQLADRSVANPKDLTKNLPFLLLDLMKNVNNLNDFNQELFNKSVKSSSKLNTPANHKRKRGDNKSAKSGKVNCKNKDSYEDNDDNPESSSEEGSSFDEELSFDEDEDDYEDEDEDEDDYDYQPHQDKSKISLIYPNFKLDTNIKRILIYYKINENKLIKTLNKQNKQLLLDYILLFETDNKLKALTSRDITYFLDLSYDEKFKIIQTEQELIALNKTEVSPRYTIINSSLPIDIKSKCLSKLTMLNNADPNSSEYNKLKNWINGILNIPWNVYKPLAVDYQHSNNTEIYSFLNDGIKKLDVSIYGQSKTKQHIINVVSKIITNPKSIGNVFSIYGPMGTGKTTLIKDGLSKLLGLPFIFISLGGSTDSSFLDGHSYTYEGSTPGRIVEALRGAKCMNPVFYFDELDKVSETSRGMEIINLLIHLTDPSQNSHFFDKYYGGVPFDLSKALFVFSFNNLEKVNPILRDRMHLIKVNGFSFDEKKKIATDYLLPSIYKEFMIDESDMVFNDEVIKYIISKKTSTLNIEEGVRNIKRRLEVIISNVNVIRIAFKSQGKQSKKKKSKLNINAESIAAILPEIKTQFASNPKIKDVLNNFKFPCEITKDIVDLFINEVKNSVPDFMYT